MVAIDPSPHQLSSVLLLHNLWIKDRSQEKYEFFFNNSLAFTPIINILFKEQLYIGFQAVFQIELILVPPVEGDVLCSRFEFLKVVFPHMSQDCFEGDVFPNLFQLNRESIDVSNAFFIW